MLWLVIGAQHQMTVEPQLSSDQCGRPAVVTLHAAASDEGLKAMLQCVRGDELQFTNFVTCQRRARQIIALHPESFAGTPFI